MKRAYIVYSVSAWSVQINRYMQSLGPITILNIRKFHALKAWIDLWSQDIRLGMQLISFRTGARQLVYTPHNNYYVL